MRLIDADALPIKFWGDRFVVVAKVDIENAPTVDAEPVRYGHWIENDNGTYSCSECHSWIPNEQHHYARYCLHCGAKMDEMVMTYYADNKPAETIVIDDLGTESRSEYNMSSLEQIIDLRLGAKLPLIVTSNYSPKDLYADGGLLEERIKSRLSEMCVPLMVTKEDRRKGKAVERVK